MAKSEWSKSVQITPEMIQAGAGALGVGRVDRDDFDLVVEIYTAMALLAPQSNQDDDHAAFGAPRVTITAAIIEAAGEALADDGVFSDDHGYQYADYNEVTIEHAVVAAFRAAGFDVRTEASQQPAPGNPSRTVSRASK